MIPANPKLHGYFHRPPDCYAFRSVLNLPWSGPVQHQRARAMVVPAGAVFVRGPAWAVRKALKFRRYVRMVVRRDYGRTFGSEVGFH